MDIHRPYRLQQNGKSVVVFFVSTRQNGKDVVIRKKEGITM